MLHFLFGYYNKVGSGHVHVRTILMAEEFSFIHVQGQRQDPWFGQKCSLLAEFQHVYKEGKNIFFSLQVCSVCTQS